MGTEEQACAEENSAHSDESGNSIKTTVTCATHYTSFLNYSWAMATEEQAFLLDGPHEGT
jgi:hypothetical protein